ncbi:MAG TPA: TCR/Tet family MFS transporter [Phycisphaerales bacterium]|nr:TCR/Tet family MFS transporter [Phycisphaerales bacterium]
MHRPKPALIFVFITLLLDVLGFGLLIPVSPRLVAAAKGLVTTGVEEKLWEHQTSMAVGLLAATYALMQFIFAPVLGSLSDRYGRRTVLLIALLGSATDYFVGACVPSIAGWSTHASLAVLFITRAINGISGATMPICGAYIADITPPEKRAAGFGIIGAAFGLGFVIGPLMGGVLGDETKTLPLIGHGNIIYPYIGAGILTLANWLYGLLIFPESLPLDRRRAFSWAKANPIGTLKWLRHHPVVEALAASLFLANLAQLGLHVVWVLSMTSRFEWTTRQVGWSLFTVGLAAAIVQGGLARRIIPAVGERACLLAGLVISVLAFIGYGIASEGWMVYTIVAIASIGGVAQPALQGIMSKAIAPNEQGLLQGAMASLMSIAGVIGPLIAANVFGWFTTESRIDRFPGAGAPFLSGALLTMLAIVPVAFIWKRMPRQVRQAPIEGALPGVK